MKKRIRLKSLILSGLLGGLILSLVASAGLRWGYSNHNGPAHWEDIGVIYTDKD